MTPVIIVLVIALIYFLWPTYSDSTAKEGAPFIPSEPDTVAKMLRTANVKKGDVVYDLGSGDGRIVIAAAKMQAKAVGVESDPLKVAYSRFMIKLFGVRNNAKIIRGNFFDANISEADVVTLFLLQDTNDKLVPKLKKELKQDAVVVSYAFALKD